MLQLDGHVADEPSPRRSTGKRIPSRASSGCRRRPPRRSSTLASHVETFLATGMPPYPAERTTDRRDPGVRVRIARQQLQATGNARPRHPLRPDHRQRLHAATMPAGEVIERWLRRGVYTPTSRMRGTACPIASRLSGSTGCLWKTASRLMQEIWDSIEEEQKSAPLTPAQESKLKRRLAAHKSDPENVIPWEQIKAEALARFQR